MLAQEIIYQIRKPTIGGNVILKLDMPKAYDRISWSNICIVMRKMGFLERFIDMVLRIMSNNWYSIIINGSRHSFLSPALFIIGAEVLSRLLNQLHLSSHFHGFYMEKRGPQINHLSFADDTIIFTFGRSRSLELIMKVLFDYEVFLVS